MVGNRQKNERTWRVPVERIVENGYNLDIKKPNAKADFEHMPPEQLVEDIPAKEHRIMEILSEIKQVLAGVGR